MTMQTLRVLLRPVNSVGSFRAGLSGVLLLAFFVQLIAPGLATAKAPALNFNLQTNSNVFTKFLESSLTNESRVRKNLNQMPMNFTLNQGQADARVKFTARGRGYSLFLTPTEAVLSLQRSNSLGSTALRMRLLQANNNPIISGLDPLSLVSNYYLGNDPSQYRENVPHFAKVKYAQVYPGIDVVYYGNQNELEYDFIIAPGADPNVIQMSFVGASNLRVADNGDLVINTKGGELRQHKPILYQTINGARHEVAGHFVVNQKQVSFAVGAYDTTQELVIDPTLTYSTYLGGFEGDEKALGVAVPAGCAGTCDSYITGEVASLTFPDTNISGGSAGGKDVFVAKMDATGENVAFMTFIGGAADDQGRGIKANAAGQTYVVGLMGSNFVVPGGVTGAVTADPAANNADAFVARLGVTGNLVNFTYLGGSGYDQANAIAFNDANTNVCVTGQTYSSNFPVTANVHDASFNGGHDVFVSRLNATLGTLNYSTFIGGGNMDYGNAIDVFGGKIYVAGNTQSSNFPTTLTGFDRAITGPAPVDAFVAILDPGLPTATELQYATYLGGNGREYGYGIAVDKAAGPNQGQYYITGRSHAAGANLAGYTSASLGFPISTSAIQGIQGGYGDVFVTRFNTSGGIVYSTFLGGSDADTAWGIQLSGTTVYIVGETDSSNAGNPFPTTGNRFQDDQPGTDAFVARIDTSLAGAAGLVFSTYFGGGDLDSLDSTDSARGIALAGTEAYVAGFTNSISTASGGSFPILPAIPYQENLSSGNLGATDCFVTRLTP
jgi:hypothetical protein